ncbi:MAG: transcriptional repressor NrdR [Acidobacteria bacterium]|nr:transcriptional repressor NrdR [Acidobacteriota bacterium]
MKCPYCSSTDGRVVDSRESKGGEVIRRRRECLACGRRFTSYEKIEEVPIMVIKKDGTREIFNPNKIVQGILKAIEKRPVTRVDIEKIVEDIEQMVQQNPDREYQTTEIGNYVMDSLKNLDKVAYVRFASVYREFKDISEFISELQDLLKEPKKKEVD